MDFATWNSIWTVLVLLLFVGICAWAFWPSRKRYFEEAGRTVLDNDDDPNGPHPGEQRKEE